MEENIEKVNSQCCFGCLTSAPDVQMHDYDVKCEVLKTVFQHKILKLCFICKKMAEHAEMFVQHVQNNQILLENFHGELSSTLSMAPHQVTPLISLEPVSLDVIDVTESDSINEDTFVECSNNITVKLEVKEEGYNADDGMVEDDLDNYLDIEDYQERLVKEEDDLPLKELLKEDIQFENINMSNLRKNTKKQKLKTKDKKTNNNETKGIENITLFRITQEQCMEERLQAAKDPKFVNYAFKCMDCIKGFPDVNSYETHMKKHSVRAGKYVCNICKQRRNTNEQLYNHKKTHNIRYKCGECGLVRLNRSSMKDHYTTKHSEYISVKIFKCTNCSKSFDTSVRLRKHIWYAHNRKKTPAACAYCNKIYAHKEGLRLHLIRRHPNEKGSHQVSKPYVCKECGMGFTAPSHLRNHGSKHKNNKDYYCVECDKSFKTEAGLNRHLKTTSPHANYLDLPLACSHCDKRFSVKRDMERHMNRVHLNIKPFTCDKCDKAYVNDWSLTQHKRFVHEGYKRPLKYPCSMCDKIFDRNSILTAHVRTHTGERPYQCGRCPAHFAQPSVLATHVKLIHLKLTRDGRPKPTANR